MKKYLVTGGSGLVGSGFVKHVSRKNCILVGIDEDSDIYLDLTDKKEIRESLNRIDFDVLVHFAAFTDLEASQKENGNKRGSIYRLNSLAPYYLARLCKKRNKKMIHISTDFVFDGKKRGLYTEDDSPNPLPCWYSITKYHGERYVLDSISQGLDGAVIRFSFPLNPKYESKPDMAKIIHRILKQGKEFHAISNQKIQPVLVSDIARAIELIINRNAKGIYHLAGEYKGSYTTPYEFAIMLAKKRKFNENLIKKTTLESFYLNCAPRPKNMTTSTQKIKKLGMRFTTLREVLREICYS